MKTLKDLLKTKINLKNTLKGSYSLKLFTALLVSIAIGILFGPYTVLWLLFPLPWLIASLLINLLLIVIFVESLLGKVHRFLMILPVMVVVSYGVLYTQNQNFVNEIKTQQENNEKLAKQNINLPDKINLVLDFAEMDGWLSNDTAEILLRNYGVNSVYSKTLKTNFRDIPGYQVSALFEMETCLRIATQNREGLLSSRRIGLQIGKDLRNPVFSEEALDRFIENDGYGGKDCLVVKYGIKPPALDIRLTQTEIDFSNQNNEIKGFKSHLITKNGESEALRVETRKFPLLPFFAMSCVLVDVNFVAEKGCEFAILNSSEVLVDANGVNNTKKSPSAFQLPLESLGFKKSERVYQKDSSVPPNPAFEKNTLFDSVIIAATPVVRNPMDCRPDVVRFPISYQRAKANKLPLGLECVSTMPEGKNKAVNIINTNCSNNKHCGDLLNAADQSFDLYKKDFCSVYSSCIDGKWRPERVEFNLP